MLYFRFSLDKTEWLPLRICSPHPSAFYGQIEQSWKNYREDLNLVDSESAAVLHCIVFSQICVLVHSPLRASKSSENLPS